jgi:ribosome-associated protein
MILAPRPDDRDDSARALLQFPLDGPATQPKSRTLRANLLTPEPGSTRMIPHRLASMDMQILALRGEYITLEALLKASGLAPSGGDAKRLIASGAVQVNGQLELRRGRKLRANDAVQVGGQGVRVQGAQESP